MGWVAGRAQVRPALFGPTNPQCIPGSPRGTRPLTRHSRSSPGSADGRDDAWPRSGPSCHAPHSSLLHLCFSGCAPSPTHTLCLPHQPQCSGTTASCKLIHASCLVSPQPPESPPAHSPHLRSLRGHTQPRGSLCSHPSHLSSGCLPEPASPPSVFQDDTSLLGHTCPGGNFTGVCVGLDACVCPQERLSPGAARWLDAGPLLCTTAKPSTVPGADEPC